MKTLLSATLFIIGFSTFAQNCLQDSMYIYNAQNLVYRKYFYTYDGNDLVSEMIQKDSSNGIWANTSKTNSIWYAPDKISEQIVQTWNNNQWVNSSKYSVTYNLNGNELEAISEIWDNGSSVWQFSSYQKYYTYNASGQRTEYLQVYWTGGAPTDSTKHTYTFDGNGNEIINLKEAWTIVEPNWRPYQKWNVTFNTNNLPDSTANLLYDVNTSSFTLIASWRDYYDANGNRIDEIVRNGSNVFSSKYSNTYDANNNRLSNSYNTWEGTYWKTNSQTNFTYNSNNQTLSYTNQNYDNGTSALINTTQYLYLYDSDNNLLEFNGYNWDANTNQWVFNYKEKRFYNCLLSVEDLLKKSDLLIYPNPTSGIITLKNINGENISIFNNLGAQIQHISGLSDNQTLDLSYLPYGIYFIQTENGTTQKFVKQ